MGLNNLYQLKPNTAYSFDTTSGKISQLDTRQMAVQELISVNLYSTASNIEGTGSTTTFCNKTPNLARTYGSMASTVSFDPFFGTKEGILIVDTPEITQSVVNFSILRVPGGQKNPMNRTSMETTHVSVCGTNIITKRVVTTWPPQRIELIVDDTGSMNEELAGLKSAIAAFITSSQDPAVDGYKKTSYELITFKDSPTLALLNSTDSVAVINAVNALSASSGGDCPEDSFGAINMALSNVETDPNSLGELIVATDASPLQGDVTQLISRAKSAGVRVNVLLSGDCVVAASKRTSQSVDSAQQVFQSLATQTGGVYIYKPSATANDYAIAFNQIFESATNPSEELTSGVTLSGINGLAGSRHIYRITVPQGANQLRVTTFGGSGNVSLYGRFESVPMGNVYDLKSTRVGNSETIDKSMPAAGTWYISVTGETDYAGVSIRATLN